MNDSTLSSACDMNRKSLDSHARQVSSERTWSSGTLIWDNTLTKSNEGLSSGLFPSLFVSRPGPSVVTRCATRWQVAQICRTTLSSPLVKVLAATPLYNLLRTFPKLAYPQHRLVPANRMSSYTCVPFLPNIIIKTKYHRPPA